MPLLNQINNNPIAYLTTLFSGMGALMKEETSRTLRRKCSARKQKRL
jgi:hypothetical protein